MRAGNKGRSLRPRTSRNSAVPPESDLTTSDQQVDAIVRDAAAAAEEHDALDAPPSVQPAAPPPDKVVVARLTPAEVLAAGRAFSHQHEDEDDDHEEAAPSTKAAVPTALKAVEEPVVAKVEKPVVARVEEPVAARKAEPVVAKKAEPVVAAKKAEEPRKAEAPQSQGNKKSEPVKAAPAKKADEIAPLRVERSAPADEEPRSGNNVNTKKKSGRGEGAKAEAKRPADDEVDTSSISAEFFRREGDSLPPLVGAHEEPEEHDEPGGAHVLSPAAIARQARLRRLVAGVVAFAGVITLAVVGKTLAASKQPMASVPVKPPVVQEAKVDPKPEEKAAPAPVKTVAAPVEAPKASAEAAKAEPDPKAAEEAKKADEEAKKAAEEPKKAEPSGGDAKALTREAESFLNRGNRKDAIVKAREAIAADPSQAMPYLYLGSALQDSGKWKDGIEAYSECVRNATKGPVHECRQMGGHK